MNEALWMLLIAAASFMAGHELAALRSYRRGFNDGSNEERCRQNERVIAARLDACKKQAIRYRALVKAACPNE